ncbi:hypothetical protein ACXR8F_21425 [Terrabacter sp. AAH1]
MSISPVLNTVPLAQAVQAVLELNREWGILPRECGAELIADLETLINAAASFRVRTTSGEKDTAIKTVAQLITHQQHVIASLIQVPAGRLSSVAVNEVSVPLHRWRNLTLALAIAAAASYRSDKRAIDEIVRKAPTLCSRTLSERRPFTDDEVFLMRTYVAATYKPSDLSAGVFALVQAGLAPGETTKVTLDHFDEHATPRALMAPGNGHVVSRYIELDPFATFVLGGLTRHNVKANLPTTGPLTYRPRLGTAPGSKAAVASAQGVINNLLKRLGLFQNDVTASSLTQWRVQTAWKTKGAEYALSVSGRSSTLQMWEALKAEPVAPFGEHGMRRIVPVD